MQYPIATRAQPGRTRSRISLKTPLYTLIPTAHDQPEFETSYPGVGAKPAMALSSHTIPLTFVVRGLRSHGWPTGLRFQGARRELEHQQANGIPTGSEPRCLEGKIAKAAKLIMILA